MRKIIFLLTVLVTQFTLQAQPPVQVTPQLLAPYTTQISDYYSAAGNPKLSLLLLNKDFNRPTLSVRLRMTIEGQGVRIKTREDVNFAPLTILSGQPYYVSPAELSQYFNVNNIELSGITQQEYIQTGKLPEGFYTYCFETVETTTGQTVSNKGCTFAWINLNEPPLLNLPARGESVIPSISAATQNVIFNWTPRHTASPGAAYTTTYIFTLVEVTDNSLAPEAAFVNGNVIHVDSTNSSTYPYDNTKPSILIEGKKYAWQVRAKTKDASSVEIANFKNNGYSEVFWFLYKNNCPPVTGIADSLNGISGYRAIISWLGNPQHLGYKIVYRERNTAGAEWFNITTTGVQAALNDLKPATEYEYRVGTACEEGVFTFAGSRYFTTKDSTYTALSVPNCGTDPNLTNPTTNPNEFTGVLSPGDTIRAGDFKVVVTNTPTPPSGSGSYTGGGYVPVSYLGNMKLAVVFSNIKLSNVNNEKRLFDGQIQTTYDPTEGGIESIDDYIDYYTGGQGPTEITGLPQADTTVGFPIKWPDGIVANLPPGYNPATGIGPVPIVITPANPPGGAAITYIADKLPKTIKDTTGNIYQVNTNGTVTLVGQAGGDSVIKKMNKDLIDDDRAIVKFVEYNDPKVKYAFDEWKTVYEKSNTFNKEYERIKTKLNNKYYVSAKAIAPAAADYLKASFTKTDASLRYDSIKFINSKGVIYNATLLDSIGGVYNYEVNIVGGQEKDAQTIYAVYPQTGAKNLNLGKVFVASYPKKVLNVKLVKVNGELVNVNVVQDSLAKIYGLLGIDVKVTIDDPPFTSMAWDLNNDGNLDTKGSNNFANFTSEMKALRDGFKGSRNTQNEFYYIFLVKSSNETANIAGEMLRNKRYGFLFTDKLKTNSNIDNGKVARILAHELGHGVFQLKHTTTYGFLESDLQDNVLNNYEGKKFAKYQWDFIFDQGFIFNFLDKDGDADFIIVNNIEVLNPFRHSNGLTFVTPSGSPITISGNLQSVSFLSPVDNLTFTGSNYKNPVPIGTINEFTILDGGISKKYQARFTFTTPGNIFNFVGFRNEQLTTDWYIDDKTKISDKSNIKVLLGTPCFKNGIVKFRVFPTDYFTATSAVWPTTNVQQVTQLVKTKFFFDDYSNREGEGVDVYGNFDLKDLNFTDVDFFLLDEIANSKDVCGKDAMFLFDVVYNVKQIESLGLCVKDGIKNVSSLIENIADSYENNQYSINFNAPDATYTKKNIVPYGYEKVSFHSRMGSLATSYEQITSRSKFELLADLIANYRSILESPIANNISNTSIDDLIKFFDKTDIRGRMCLMKSFSISKRIDLIDRLNSATIPFSDRKENFIASLTETVPDTDYDAFITNLEGNNNQKFWSVYNDLHMSQYGRFMVSLTSMMRQRDKLTHPDESETELNAKILSGDFRNGTYHAITIDETNYIAEITGNPRQIRIGSVLGRSFLGDPFEFILVKFTNDFNFPNVTNGDKFIKANTILKIPAITLYWILNSKNTQETLTAVRIVVDVCIVTLAVASGGAASPLLVFDGLIAGADMAFAFADNAIDMSNNQELKDLRDGWNVMVGIIGAAQVLSGSLKYVTGRIAKFSKISFSNKVQSLKNSAIEIKNFRLLLQRLIKDLPFDYGGRAVITKILNNARLEAEINSFYKQIGTKTPSFFVEQDNLVLKLLSPANVATTNISLGKINKELSVGNYLYLETALLYNKAVHGEIAQVLGNIVNGETIPSTAYIYAKQGGGYVKGEFDLVETVLGKIYLAPKNLPQATKVGLLLKLESFTSLKVWVNTLDEVIDGRLISKLDDLNANYLAKLEIDIASTLNGSGVKLLLKESPDDLIDIWKTLKDDPKYSFELAKTGGSRWEKWAQGNFFKAVTKAGKDFEIVAKGELQAASSVLKSKLASKYNINLSQYEVFEQVQIKTGQIVNGKDEFFVADFVLVKKKIVLGQEILDLDNAIVLETKLSSTTRPTGPQINAIDKVKTSSNTFNIRSVSQEGVFNNTYTIGNTNQLKINDFIKVYSDGVGTTVQDIISLK